MYFGWGSLYLAIRIAVQSIPPFLMAGTSSLAAGFFLYVMAAISGAGPAKPSHWKSAFFAGMAMLAVGNGCVVWAEQKVPSGVTALILATEPAWFVLIDWLCFGAKKPSWGVFAGILVGFVGVGLLVGDGLGAQTFPMFDAFLILIAAVGWSWGSVYSRHADLPGSPLLAMSMTVLLGGAALFLIGLCSGELSRFDLSGVEPPAMIAFLYITFVSYGLTYIAYGWLLKNVSIARISTYAYVNPLVALALGAWIAHERITFMTFLGAAAIFFSVLIILGHSKSNTAESRS